MKNMLLIGTNFEGTATIYENLFNKELSKHFNIFFYGKNHEYNIENNYMEKIIKDNFIDIVVCHHNVGIVYSGEFFNLKFPNKYMFLSDFHENYNLLKNSNEYMKESDIKKIFAKAMCDKFLKNENIIFFPWSLDEKVYKFQNNDKKYDVCIFGSNTDFYSLRQTINNEINDFSQKNNIKIITGNKNKASKYDNNFLVNYDEEKKKVLKVGEEYIKTLQETKIMLFGAPEKYKYPIKKYFECASSGCLALADKPYLSEKLGFVDGETFVEINENNWKEKTLYYLKNEKERERIIQNARKNFENKHTNTIRINLLLKELNYD